MMSSSLPVLSPLTANGVARLCRQLSSAALGLALALLVLPMTTVGAKATDLSAEAFIQNLGEETLTLISNPDITEAEKQGVFRRLLVANTDMRRFGRSALGRYSRVPSDIEFAEYLDALEDYAVAILSARFSLFADHEIDVAGSQVKEGRSSRYVVVTTDLREESRRLVAKIQWVLINRDDDYRIFDIVVRTPSESGSFSLLKTQRDEFTRILRANGRDTNKLIAHLRKGAASQDVAPGSISE